MRTMNNHNRLQERKNCIYSRAHSAEFIALNQIYGIHLSKSKNRSCLGYNGHISFALKFRYCEKATKI